MKIHVYKLVPKLVFSADSITEVAKKLKVDRPNCYRILNKKYKTKFLLKTKGAKAAPFSPSPSKAKRSDHP